MPRELGSLRTEKESEFFKTHTFLFLQFPKCRDDSGFVRVDVARKEIARLPIRSRKSLVSSTHR